MQKMRQVKEEKLLSLFLKTKLEEQAKAVRKPEKSFTKGRHLLVTPRTKPK